MNTREFNNIVHIFGENLFRFIFKSVNDVDFANDITQDTFLKLWENKSKINPEKVKSWLFSTAHNTMLNRIKKESRTESIQDFHLEKPFTWDKSLEQNELINLCLEQLPQLQKSIILLRDLEGYNYAEIGEMLELTEAKVKVYLFRARTKMKNLIKDISYIID